MPIEIKELHIKAVVAGKEKDSPSTGQLGASDIARLKKEIIKEVTDKVLRLIRQKNER